MHGGFNSYECGTCSAWRQDDPENKILGNCMRVPVLSSDGVITLIRPNDWRDSPQDVTRDIAILRTTADFGCVGYTPKTKLY
jgi:hypothetical protein